MNPSVRRGGSAAGMAVVLALALAVFALPAAARDFAGKVASVSSRMLQVESRMGDTRDFEKGSDTVVSGARKRWDELAVGDSVVVSWSLGDSKPVAHQVRVRSAGSR